MKERIKAQEQAMALAQEENAEVKKQEPVYDKVEGVTNILLIGADFREGDTSARSDTMIIATIDSNTNKIKLTSLLRDMLVYIPGHGKSKLNHAFAYGGVDLLMQTISYNFGLDLDKYVIVDFNSFKDVIDTLGGVDVEIRENEINELNKYIYDIKGGDYLEFTNPGMQTLNGTQALAFVRIRYNTGGEERRTERQREVLSALYNKFKDTSVVKYPAILKDVYSNIETNMSIGDMLNLIYTGFKLDVKNIETLQLPIESIAKGGLYKDYGWVFRTDLGLLSQVLADYIWKDMPVDINNYDTTNLNYME